MRILYTTTIGLTMIFFKSLVKRLIEAGHTVDIAANESDYQVDDVYRQLGCRVFQVNWQRSPLSRQNLKAIKELRAIVAAGNYDIVHCHTPVAGFCTRYACKQLRKQGLRVFYTAHGFHFYKGAPLKNWLIYYPVEKYSSRFTDVLITITKEDFALAERKMKAVKLAYIPGVGVDAERFRNTVTDVDEKRRELGIPAEAFLFLSVGELNQNKNHRVFIQALKKINDPGVHYAIAGTGDKKEELQQLADELGLTDRVRLLGYRNDVAELYKAADAYVLPSLREGLNVSLMEAICSGLPVICGNIRGNRDLVLDGKNGFLVDTADPGDVSKAALKIMDGKLRDADGVNNELEKQISFASVYEQTAALYFS